MAWDINLCTDYKDKVLVPFHYFVEAPLQLSETPSCQVIQFLDLPTDIQLIVYEHCDLPTLFHLMRTCSHTRGPAAKLFWMNTSENTWYHNQGYELFDYGSHHHPIVKHCAEFAHRITKIELYLMRLEFRFAEGKPLYGRQAVSTAAKAEDFWDKVGKAFPAVKRVVLDGMMPRRPLPPPSGEYDEDYAIIETVVKRAPPHIIVQVAFDDGSHKRPPRYRLWQVASGFEPTWTVIDELWTPTRVLLPPRRFANSPLGDVLTFTRRNYALMLEGRGIRWLMIESYARYALDGVIHCPRLDCDATFTERDQWKQHLEDTEHWRLGPSFGYVGDHMTELIFYKGTPKAVQSAIKARQLRIEADHRQTLKLQRRVGCAFGEHGSEERRLFEKLFAAQLREENFAAPGELLTTQPGEVSHGWDEWMNNVSMYFDKTHIYYAGE